MIQIECKNIFKSFNKIEILKNISFEIEQGTSNSICGKSGCGKSTLLHICAGLLTPDNGSVNLFGKNIREMSGREIAILRNRQLGFVFQSCFLLEDFNVAENIAVPAMIAGISKKDALKKAMETLDRVGLLDKAKSKVSVLSGGEKQRIAVCRAIINNPAIIFADEPTGSLDEDNALLCENLLLDLVKEDNRTLVLVTHNPDFAAKCKHSFEIRNHEIEKIY